MIFLKFIMAEEKSCPPKPLQKIPVGSQAHRALNCLPKVDELFIVTELACESTSSLPEPVFVSVKVFHPANFF
jgi:hypothetical protein